MPTPTQKHANACFYPEFHPYNMGGSETDFKIGDLIRGLFSKIAEFFVNFFERLNSTELYPEYADWAKTGI